MRSCLLSLYGEFITADTIHNESLINFLHKKYDKINIKIILYILISD